MKIGNTTLVDYGIQNEKSDLRAHVCVLARRVYVYQTKDGAELVKSGGFKTRPTYTGNILTALGCAVPVAKIPGVQEVEIPGAWIKYLDFRPNDTPTDKGKKAIRIVKTLLKRGLFPLLPISVKEISDKQMQISGTDIRIDLQAQVNIQVKCDYMGGDGHLLCTGNLYLQTQECNPYGFT